eukprot:CAMPEP_0177335434 /NCGR_PEP_ID=MMETSP0368-20130122/23252_1 /TAXON_ID=447022 ORGANISM="Scrippsiella hangoei-like, Strain SHHI-4" /NCGR_SAMPLE_ID=MMETSP0368 /ASSEMBLY_ACC=CAM_ASM_000363 /LENGTH=336 /DNA_ID=CAMNT_0018796223 /DNA_START=13 /DNA_END=1023 /DNA_ORIENTATION=+
MSVHWTAAALNSTVCPRGVGAAVEWPTLLEHLTSPGPDAYEYLLPVTVACTAISAAISARTVARLLLPARKSEAPGLLQPRLVLMMIPSAAPLVIAFLELAIVLAPRSWKVLHIVVACFEVICFWAFLRLLLNFIGGSTGDVAAALARIAPRRVWRCSRRDRAPGMWDVRVVQAMVAQFMIVLPALAAIELDEHLVETRYTLWAAVHIVSLVSCVVAELSLIRMAGDIIEHHNCHLKFWSMKTLFIGNMASFRIAGRVVQSDQRIGELCYTHETLAAGWSAAITTFIAVIVAALIVCGFKPKDLQDPQDPDPIAQRTDGEPQQVEEGLQPASGRSA